jgi:hypothetical protein
MSKITLEIVGKKKIGCPLVNHTKKVEENGTQKTNCRNG